MAESQQPYIEYNPNLRDQAAGAIGRIGMHALWEPEAAYEPQSGSVVHHVLDTYAARLHGNALDPQSEDARLLTEHFHSAPQLESPLFLPGGVKGNAQKLLTIAARPDAPIQLPVRNFVHATGLEDWNQGRGGYKSGHGSGSSRQTIRSYAKKTTPMPPIGMVTAHVQPDGHVLYASVQDGAHRVAAAHLRGDQSIAVGGTVVVKRLSDNVITPRRQ